MEFLRQCSQAVTQHPRGADRIGNWPVPAVGLGNEEESWYTDGSDCPGLGPAFGRRGSQPSYTVSPCTFTLLFSLKGLPGE